MAPSMSIMLLFISVSNLAADVADVADVAGNGVIHAGTAWGRYVAGAPLNIIVVHYALARLRLISAWHALVRLRVPPADVAVLGPDLVGLVAVCIGGDGVAVCWVSHVSHHLISAQSTAPINVLGMIHQPLIMCSIALSFVVCPAVHPHVAGREQQGVWGADVKTNTHRVACRH